MYLVRKKLHPSNSLSYPVQNIRQIHLFNIKSSVLHDDIFLWVVGPGFCSTPAMTSKIWISIRVSDFPFGREVLFLCIEFSSNAHISPTFSLKHCNKNVTMPPYVSFLC